MPFTLVGEDTFEHEMYDLDGEYKTYDEAKIAAHKRLKYLESTQPSQSSGGQGFGGIQDRVYIKWPSGKLERILS